MTVALIVGLFVLAVVVLVALPRGKAAEPTSEPRVDWHDVRERISPHFRGTVGVCTAFILFCSLLLILAEPSAIKYVWLIPLLVAVVYLMVWVRKTVENELVRGIIYVSVVVVLAITVGPTLPGSTPARAPVYTQDQMTELARLKQKCPGEKMPFNYTEYYQIVNWSSCTFDFWIGPNNRIYIRDAQGIEHGPYCEQPECVKGRIQYEIKEVRSGGGAFWGHIKKTPDYKTLSFRYAGD